MKLILTDHTSVCQQCGMVTNRALNAAENLNRTDLARNHVCRHDGSVSYTYAYEATSMDEAGSERAGMITIAHS